MWENATPDRKGEKTSHSLKNTYDYTIVLQSDASFTVPVFGLCAACSRSLYSARQ